MLQLLKAIAAAVGRFVLPWLFAGWLFWMTTVLPLSWPVWVSVGVAIVVGYLLQKDAKSVLEKFCRFDEAVVTPGSKVSRRCACAAWEVIGSTARVAVSSTPGCP